MPAAVPPTVDRADVLRLGFRRHQLHREPDTVDAEDIDLLDFGVQDTGPDGAPWALAQRGARTVPAAALLYAWTIRGAPHAYRRSDMTSITTAVTPYSSADAGRRIFDAVKPLKAAGIDPLDALRTVAGHMRTIVTGPTGKGELSSRLTEVLDDPYLRWCRPCQATHAYEQTFRLAALQAGLEIEAGTSPPVLRRVPDLAPPMVEHLGGEAPAGFDVVRNYLRFYGPADPRSVATFLDAPVKDVKAHWPEDTVRVTVSGSDPASRSDLFLLVEDLDALTGAPSAPDTTDGRPGVTARLLGPFDPYVQGRNRELLVPDMAARKDVWRTPGRPGTVVTANGEVAATWRPRTAGRKLSLLVQEWRPLTAGERAGLAAQGERLAAHRGVTFAGVTAP